MRVLVAMSGGVDSSVAAYLLAKQGYEVIGATMQVWDYSKCEVVEGQGTCCSSQDVDDARSVADSIGIPFYVINCEKEFKEKVITPFVQSYLKGETPLPCSNCNTFLKFDYLVRKMKELNCDYLATGHYAQIKKEGNEAKLILSDDGWKDQTYFLFTLPKQLLSKLLFPVGHLKKSEVRKIAKEANLVIAKKRDSTGICFVGNGEYSKFVEAHVEKEVIQKQKGLIRRYPSRQVMGEHSGIHNFTIGQCRGLGMTHHEKLFVIKIDPNTKEVWVGDEDYLFKHDMIIENVSWLAESEILNQELIFKIRSTHPGASGKIFTSEVPGQYRVSFDQPQRAITPGQAAVFYRENQLLGGGWIL